MYNISLFFFSFQDSLKQESDVVNLESYEAEKAPDSSQLEDSASDTLDASCSVNKEEILTNECDTEEPSSSSLCQRIITPISEKAELINEVCHTDDECYVLEDGGQLIRECEEELPFREERHFPDDISSVNAVMENTRPIEETIEESCELMSSKISLPDDHTSGVNASLYSIDCSSQQSLPNNKDWAPATCGEATSSELIDSSDRQQPSASVIFDKPIVIDRNVIQDVEKEHNMEFFMGRALKTPERYMKIRNYILDMWEKIKPNFLFKTAVRGGLRNCGDVNSIGRVHAFLEDIGAINEGCLDRPVPRVREQGEVTNVKENIHMESWVNSLRPRKKRQRNMDGDWVDPGRAEGMTIQVTGYIRVVLCLGFKTSPVMVTI